MEINKAPVSSQYLASLLRQREVAGVSKKVDATAEPPAVSTDTQDRRRESLDAGELRAALLALEESQGASQRGAQKEGPVLNNRARMALNSYLAQENLARDDTRLSLRQMLGIDDYA